MDNGCDGGWPGNILFYLNTRGTMDAVDYPYEDRNTSNCRMNDSKSLKCPVATEEAYLYSGGNCMRLKQLLTFGPVLGAIQTTTFLSSYESGVFRDNPIDPFCTEEVNHAIVIVGWQPMILELNITSEVFIVRNSWSRKYGDNGYVYVDASTNTCQICKYFWYYYLAEWTNKIRKSQYVFVDSEENNNFHRIPDDCDKIDNKSEMSNIDTCTWCLFRMFKNWYWTSISNKVLNLSYTTFCPLE